MSDMKQGYAAKRMTAAEAAALIPSGAKVATGLGFAQPPAILGALAERARGGGVKDVSLYYLLASSNGAAILDPDIQDRLRAVSLFHAGPDRALDKALAALGRPPMDFIPTAFCRVPAMLRDDVGVNVVVTTVAPMDENGNFSLSIDTDYIHALAHSAPIVILEVNPALPQVQGNCHVPLERVTALVENHVPLVEMPSAQIRPEDEAIGRLVADMVDDGACLQMGIGAVPDAVCAALMDRQHLGIHTELLTPGLVKLERAGVVDNSRKANHKHISVFTFAMGDRDFYDYLDNNPAFEAYPVEYVNDPHLIATNDRMVSVNATIEIDLEGACNSENVGGRQYSGIGGQLDFVRGASASRGGKSIIACHSTAAGGKISRIVPRLGGPVTTPRTDVQYIATEYGIVNMRGKTLKERARALIDIAHPDFREELEREAHARFGDRLVAVG